MNKLVFLVLSLIFTLIGAYTAGAGVDPVFKGLGSAVSFAGGSGLITFFLAYMQESGRKKREDTDRAKELNSLLKLFALEAVELQDRWVQYVRQVLNAPGKISGSSPYELTTPDQVNQLIKLGVDTEIISSIYYVKEVTNDVRRQVLRAFDQLQALKTKHEGELAQMSIQAMAFPNELFFMSAAFIRDRWTRTEKAVADILTAADPGNLLAILRNQSRKNCNDYHAMKDRLKPPADEVAPHPK